MTHNDTEHDAEMSDADFVADSLRHLEPVEPSPTLMRRVAQIPLDHARKAVRWWWPFESIWQPSMGLGAAAVLGLVVGTQTAAMPTEGAEAAAATAATSATLVDDEGSEGTAVAADSSAANTMALATSETGGAASETGSALSEEEELTAELEDFLGLAFYGQLDSYDEETL